MQYFTVYLDYETAERCGATGTFQVISIEDPDDTDRTELVDQGIHFHNLDQLAAAIAKALGVSPAVIDLQEV